MMTETAVSDNGISAINYADGKLTGRSRLLTALDDSASVKDIVKDMEEQSSAVSANQSAAKWLWDYARNRQTILDRVDDSEGASSNNKIVVNYAVAISRNLCAYTFPKGIKYLSKSADAKRREFVEKLNSMMAMKSNNVAAQEMKWYQSVCGHAFLYVNYDESDADVPFTLQCVPPWNAYVVYSAFDIYKPVYGVIEYKDEKMVFTNNRIIKVSSGGEIVGEENKHVLNAVPVVEVPNNTMRLGDFEIAVSLLDGINSVASDSVNNVQDIVKSYLVLFGVDREDVEKQNWALKSILAFPAQQGVNQSAQFIHASLDGSTVQQLRSYMDQALKFVTGIPDRDTDNATSSTGVSEDIRTGQADKDAIANEKSVYVEEVQRKVLEIILNILRIKNTGIVPDGLTAADIDIDITRANRDNILTKTQAMLNMKQLGMANEDVIYFGNITNDVPGVVERMNDTTNVENSEQELDDLLRSMRGESNDSAGNADRAP